MNDNFHQSEKENDEENLNNENEFLKMKLMLEHGGEFGTAQTDNELSPGVENDFLNYIMEWEKQAAERKTIQVYDRIKRPTHFKPVNEIPDNEIDSAWDELDNYLNKYHIDLAVCSPNISNRELYRFATEELFDYEMDDIFIPGGMTCFTYDEFYPDHIYDNTRYATDDCIKQIFEKDPITFMMWFQKDNIRLNNNFPLNEEEYKTIINRFKSLYGDIRLNDLTDIDCAIEDTNCRVKGVFEVTLILPSEDIKVEGNWLVKFNLDDYGYWRIYHVKIEGLNF